MELASLLVRPFLSDRFYIIIYLFLGKAEHIEDPREHDTEHVADDDASAAPQPEQLDHRRRRYAQGDKTVIISYSLLRIIHTYILSLYIHTGYIP